MTGFRRIVLVGDSPGIRMLRTHVPAERVACLVGAAIRPQYHASLAQLAQDMQTPLLIQPRFGTDAFPSFVQTLRSLACDLLLCNSYSMLIRPEMLDVVSGNAFNLHYSLLPKNRGPNPIQWAILRGENETGATLHQMDDRFDGGDIVAQLRVPIHLEDTWVTVLTRLDHQVHDLLAQTIPKILDNDFERRPQDEAAATQNQRLTPDFPRIDFATMTDRQIFNLIRAQVHPLHGAYVEHAGERVHFDLWMSMQEVAELRKKYAG